MQSTQQHNNFKYLSFWSKCIIFQICRERHMTPKYSLYIIIILGTIVQKCQVLSINLCYFLFFFCKRDPFVVSWYRINCRKSNCEDFLFRRHMKHVWYFQLGEIKDFFFITKSPLHNFTNRFCYIYFIF